MPDILSGYSDVWEYTITIDSGEKFEGFVEGEHYRIAAFNTTCEFWKQAPVGKRKINVVDFKLKRVSR